MAKLKVYQVGVYALDKCFNITGTHLIAGKKKEHVKEYAKSLGGTVPTHSTAILVPELSVKAKKGTKAMYLSEVI